MYAKYSWFYLNIIKTMFVHLEQAPSTKSEDLLEWCGEAEKGVI